MKAIVVREHGGLDALRREDLDTPAPSPGQVLVKVAACAVNHLDLWVRRGVPGHTFPLPLIPGNDVAGTVAAAPEDDSLKEGAAVVVSPGTSCGHCRPCLSGRDHHCRHYGILGEHRDGGYAEYVVVPRANIVAKPECLSFVEAAAIGIPFLTAWHMLVDRAALRPGETVLVQAGGSGVGSAAIQIAKLWGARVIATASTQTKRARAVELGADHCIDYTGESVPRRVKEISDGAGADIVFEHVGAATWQDSLHSLAWRGRLVTCGATTGAEGAINLRHLFFESLSILGSTMGSKGDFCEIVEHVAAGRLRPVVDRVLPLRDAAEAHRLLEAREVFGKIILTTGG